MTVFERFLERINAIEGHVLTIRRTTFFIQSVQHSFKKTEMLKRAISQMWLDTASNQQQFRIHELCAAYALLERAEKRVNSLFNLFFASEN